MERWASTAATPPSPHSGLLDFSRDNDNQIIDQCINASMCGEVLIARQVPLEWALPLYGYVMPIITLVTLVTNTGIVVVLSHRQLRTPTNLVLMAMAVTELLTALSCVPWLLYYYTLRGYEVDAIDGLPAFWCLSFPYLAQLAPTAFHTMAIWLTVYLAIQRFVYICVPRRVHSFCTIRKSKRAIVVICVLSTWVALIELLGPYNRSLRRYGPNKLTPHTVSRRECLRTPSAFMLSVGNNTYHYMIIITQTVFIHLLPSVLLCAFTARLIQTMRLADRRHMHLMNRTTRRKFSELHSVDISTVVNNNNSSSNNNNNNNNSSNNGNNNSYEAVSNGGTGPALPNGMVTLTTPSSCHNNALSSSSFSRGFSRNTRNKSSMNETRRVQGLKQNTRMLLAVIFLFLVVEIPAACIFMTHIAAVGFRLPFVSYSTLNVLLIIKNLLIVVTYPLRFAIYCGMSAQFRDVFRHIIGRRRASCRPTRDVDGGSKVPFGQEENRHAQSHPSRSEHVSLTSIAAGAGPAGCAVGGPSPLALRRTCTPIGQQRRASEAIVSSSSPCAPVDEETTTALIADEAASS